MKIFFLLLMISIITSCGVKNDPLNPMKHAYPSVIEKYQERIKNKYHGQTQPSSLPGEQPR